MFEYANVENGAVVLPIIRLASALDPSHPKVAGGRLRPVEESAFDPVTQVREGFTYVVEPTRVVRQFTTRSKTQAEIDEMKAAKVAAVRSEGNRRLNLLVTMAAQVQALTRLVQLLYLHTDRSGWPTQQQNLATLMLQRLQNIQDIRQTEDAKVSEVQALSTPVEINAYDETAGWA
jgi:hypothetical protein